MSPPTVPSGLLDIPNEIAQIIINALRQHNYDVGIVDEKPWKDFDIVVNWSNLVIGSKDETAVTSKQHGKEEQLY